MARREATVVITREGRDQGKAFTIREMPADQGEDWATRALMLVARGGVDIPPYIFQTGFQGFFILGIGAVMAGLGKAPYGEVKPLLNEMLGCVTGLATPTVPVTSLPLIMGQIEEVATILQLREEVLSLHLGFSLAARLSEYRQMFAAIMTAEPGPNTPTSQDQSA